MVKEHKYQRALFIEYLFFAILVRQYKAKFLITEGKLSETCLFTST